MLSKKLFNRDFKKRAGKTGSNFQYLPAATAGQPGRFLYGLGQLAEALFPLTYRDNMTQYSIDPNERSDAHSLTERPPMSTFQAYGYRLDEPGNPLTRNEFELSSPGPAEAVCRFLVGWKSTEGGDCPFNAYRRPFDDFR